MIVQKVFLYRHCHPIRMLKRNRLCDNTKIDFLVSELNVDRRTAASKVYHPLKPLNP